MKDYPAEDRLVDLNDARMNAHIMWIDLLDFAKEHADNMKTSLRSDFVDRRNQQIWQQNLLYGQSLKENLIKFLRDRRAAGDIPDFPQAVKLLRAANEELRNVTDRGKIVTVLKKLVEDFQELIRNLTESSFSETSNSGSEHSPPELPESDRGENSNPEADVAGSQSGDLSEEQMEQILA